MKSLHTIPNEIRIRKTPKKEPQKLFWVQEDCVPDCERVDLHGYHRVGECARLYLTGTRMYNGVRIYRCDCWSCSGHYFVWNRRYRCNACRSGNHPIREPNDYAHLA